MNKLFKKENSIYDLKDSNNNPLIHFDTRLHEAAHIFGVRGMQLGMLNLRQPRNMEGDIVISKMAKNKGNGEYYIERESGNISRMNYVDAIKPQDADFDFDKSFNYVAAPGRFWAETNRLAGYVTGADPKRTIYKAFDPSLDKNAASFAKHIADLIGKDVKHESVLAEVERARGLFIKMHQTTTYLANIFKNNPEILSFSDRTYSATRETNLILRLNSKGKYHTTVDNISLMAKEFIDVYSNLPAIHRVQGRRLQEKQNEILFGENGIFELGYRERPGSDFTPLKGYKALDYSDVVKALRIRLIDPINQYLKYNQGLSVDESGQSKTAALADYANAYENLVYKTLDVRKNWGISPDIRFEKGIETARQYFESTRNTYDLGMRSLYNSNKKQIKMRENQYNKPKLEEQILFDYFENGLIESGGTPETRYNKWFNIALKEYVKDEGSSIKLERLVQERKALEIDIENELKIPKNR